MKGEDTARMQGIKSIEPVYIGMQSTVAWTRMCPGSTSPARETSALRCTNLKPM